MFKGYWRALLVAPLLAAPVGAFAGGAKQDAQGSITVQAATQSVEHWSARVAGSLDRELVYPRPIGREDYHQGLSKIAFRYGDHGVPSNVTVLQSSGSRDLDRAALDAVQRISTLSPLPDGISGDHPFQAWIVFAGSESDQARILKSVQREARLANAEAARQVSRTAAATMPTIIVAAP